MHTKIAVYASLAALALPGALVGQQPQEVVVLNFPAVQAVTGEVKVQGLPEARLESERAVVAPGRAENVGSLTEGGVIDCTGFGSVVLSLAGEVKGTLLSDGKIGALLIPDQPELLKAVREQGIVALALVVEARVGPATTELFASDQPAARLGFPRYRIFYYNSTPRAAEVKLWAYLTVR